MPDLKETIEDVFGQRPASIQKLSGGGIATVSCIRLPGGTCLVAKQPRTGQPDTTAIEAGMLRYLKEKSTLPVPDVLHQQPGLLVMDYLETGGRMTAAAEIDAARHIAALHGVTADQYGLAFDTVIGPLPQPNRPDDDWGAFFCSQRLLHMGRQALDTGRIDARFFVRIERFAGKLEGLIENPSRPSLLHGDIWSGNVLVAGDTISGFIDPAISYGHAEMDLAFSTLFGTFGDAFFSAYQEIRPIEEGFFEVRRDIYNLWPLLVHGVLFGGSYIAEAGQILRRHGV